MPLLCFASVFPFICFTFVLFLCIPNGQYTGRVAAGAVSAFAAMAIAGAAASSAAVSSGAVSAIATAGGGGGGGGGGGINRILSVRDAHRAHLYLSSG